MKEIKAFINLSMAAAMAPKLTQGGGGNTSVKVDGVMTIKASGFRLDEVSKSAGYVKVNYLPIQKFLQSKKNTFKQADVKLKQFVNTHIIGNKAYLPSMETGFHAVLKDYVIHTHPIEVNQIMCCSNGNEIIHKIFDKEQISVFPILNPGYYLSKAIADTKDIASIIFLQNHGLIVHADTEQEVIQLHEAVIAKLSSKLEFENNLHFELTEISDHLFELKSELLELYFSQQGLLSSTYFPDQAVVIGNDYGYWKKHTTNKKLNFNLATNKCHIKSNYKTALAVSENLVALANIVAYANEKKLPLNTLKEEDVAYILGMDMEKYRQELLK